MPKFSVFFALLALFATANCESAETDKFIKCYQCTDNVLAECELSQSSSVNCLRATSVCLLKRRKGANPDSTLAIRKCVIPPITPCENGYDCTQCDDDLCNDVIKPKIDCYQCPLSIKGGCKFLDAIGSQVRCLGNSDSCLLQYPEDEDGSSENAIRRCINGSYKCPDKQKCLLCTGNLCNSGISLTFSITTMIIIAIVNLLN